MQHGSFSISRVKSKSTLNEDNDSPKHTILMRFFFTMIATMTVMTVFSQQTLFVAGAGSGSKDGSSWANASGSLIKTIENARSGDAIWVAAGTYKGGFFMKEGVSVYGGFSGSETQLNQRKLPGTNENLSILDGDSNFRVLTQSTDFSTPTVWDGFVIQNGSSQNGAGVYLLQSGIVRRCIIKNNYATLPSVGDYIAEEGGVVFLVDRTNKRAWVISEEDCGRNYQISQQANSEINTIEEAVSDMNGRINTALLTKSRAAQAIQAYKGANKSGWYLPSAGEWALFLKPQEDGTFKKTTVFDVVEKALQTNGKTTLAGKKYWSSTLANNNRMASAWYANFKNEDIRKVNAWQYNRIRGIRYYDFVSSDGKGGGISALTGSRIEGCLITENQAVWGSGIYARGNVIMVNNTMVNNILEGPEGTSSTIDANALVKVYNTIVAGNSTSSGDEEKYSGAAYYGHSAVEASSVAAGESNLLLNNIQEIGFVDAAQKNYKLTSGSPLAEAGNIAYLTPELDTDLSGQTRATGQKVSIGAYQSEYSSGIENNNLLSGSIQIYPNPVRRGKSVHINLNASGYASRQVFVEIHDIGGKKIVSEKMIGIGDITTPQTSGTYVLRILVDSKAVCEQKLIVTQ